MKTIVQEYGPIYGEPVNGTVMGRPNGSVYVPHSNTITLNVAAAYHYIAYHSADSVRIVDSSGTLAPAGQGARMIAEAQDLASVMQLQLYTDAECTVLAAHRNAPAGSFNNIYRSISEAIEGLTDGQTLYLRAQLINNGVAVATSDVIEVTMVVP